MKLEICAMRAGVNFLSADIWLNRFRPGIYEIDASRKQIEFLEGIKLKEDRLRRKSFVSSPVKISQRTTVRLVRLLEQQVCL